jgi:hypothetical protein
VRQSSVGEDYAVQSVTVRLVSELHRVVGRTGDGRLNA